jgi:uncharacterized protein (TIGR02117 family)
LKRRRRWTRRLAGALALAVAGFAAAVMATARPRQPDLYPPAPDAVRVEIFIVSHGYHAGVALPRPALADGAGRAGGAALSAIATRFADHPFVEIGWGDAEFYRSVPTAGALTLSLAAHALFTTGNPSVLHVVGLPQSPPAAFPVATIVRVELSEQGFARLLARLEATFAPGSDGRPLEDLGPGIYGQSRFFRAVGWFSLAHVCNHWVADLLDAAGVPTAPVLATLPGGLFLDLRWRSGLRPLAR